MTSLRKAQQLLCILLAVTMIGGCTSPDKDTSGNSADSAGFSDDDFDSDVEAAAADTASDGAVDADLASEDLGETDAVADNAPAEDGELTLDGEDSTPSADIVEDDLKLDDDTGSGAAAVADSGENLDEDLNIEEPPVAGPETAPKQETIADLVAPAPSQAEPTISASSADISVTDLRYVARKGGGTVVIETTGPATFRTRDIPAQNQVIVEISGAHLPERLKRPYVTKDFGQSIASVNAYQDPGSTTARFVIQFKSSGRAAVTQSGKQLLVVAADAGDSGSFVADAADSDSESDDGSEQGVRTVGAKGGSNDSRIMPASSTEMEVSGDIRFYGRPINIEVRDTPVKDVINLIAEQSGANLVVAGLSENDSNISLKLKQIPWDQALMIVMKAKNLGYVRQGNVLRIAPLELIQKETDDAKKIIDAQRAAEPLKVKVIPVSYAKVDELEKKVSPFLTPNRGKVTSDTRTSSVIVTDTPDILDRVSNLIRALDTPPLQVLIEGKVVEARETFKRNYGINWGYTGQDVNLGGNLSLGQNLSISPTASSTGMSTGAANLGVRLGTLDIFGDLAATLALAETEDLVKVVSSPRVTTMNNSPALILQSNNVFIATTQIVNGVSQITYQKQPVELRLEVTPQITAESDVIMNLNIKREFVGTLRENLPPDINTREAKTTVMVRNGQTAVVGGIYQSDATESEAGVPWLRDIPVLGWLFKARTTQREKTELLLFLTPRILNAEKTLAKESTL